MIPTIIIVFYLVLGLMFWLMPPKWSLSKKVFLGLIIGILYGNLVHFVVGSELEIDKLHKIQQWVDLLGRSYLILLQMIVIPLVFVSVLASMVKLYNIKSLGKMVSISLGLLLMTTAIAAMVGIFYALNFNLNIDNLIQGTREVERLQTIQGSYLTQISNLTIPEWIISVLPQNIFVDLAAARPTSVISVVIFAVLLGLAALAVKKEHQMQGAMIFKIIEVSQLWVMKLVRIILQLTPYGVMALMVSVIMSANQKDILQLASFIGASYLALLTMFLVHDLLLMLVKIPPLAFLKKVLPVLAFAFSSRSSAASIPLEIETLTKKVGVPESLASFVSTFGTTIGQNGCAGIYPAMLAIMVAPSVGINVFEPSWLLTLIAVTTFSSIGVAGVGGGATFAALIVLTTMNLPITIVALLISIEPLIDMGRTALNVNGIMTSATITSKILGLWDKSVFHTTEVEEN